MLGRREVVAVIVVGGEKREKARDIYRIFSKVVLRPNCSGLDKIYQELTGTPTLPERNEELSKSHGTLPVLLQFQWRRRGGGGELKLWEGGERGGCRVGI